MSNYGPFGSFELNSIIRGAHLTFVGAYRALQNPRLFTSDHYRQAGFAVLAGFAILLILSIPAYVVRLCVSFAGLFTDLEGSHWDEDVLDIVSFIEHSVLQVPFFLISLLRHVSPAMDGMFMDSLRWVDETYVKKHEGERHEELRAMYWENLRQYGTKEEIAKKRDGTNAGQRVMVEGLTRFLLRVAKRGGLSLAIYAASFVPVVGRFVLPAASFYTFHKSVGLQPALIVFGTSLILPKRYLVMFLQSYFSSRSLMRELLDPYFKRIRYTPEQKKQWFRDREGVLYGFAFAFFVALKIPLFGVLIYGIAEASTAFLITKITEPPPPPAAAEEFKKKDIRWENKQRFLQMPLEAIDKLNASTTKPNPLDAGQIKGRQFS